jgi:hypothetical protein
MADRYPGFPLNSEQAAYRFLRQAKTSDVRDAFTTDELTTAEEPIPSYENR